MESRNTTLRTKTRYPLDSLSVDVIGIILCICVLYACLESKEPTFRFFYFSSQISRGYHETVTCFYIRIISEAMKGMNSNDLTFDEFIENQPWILDRHLLFEFYSDERINDRRASLE